MGRRQGAGERKQEVAVMKQQPEAGHRPWKSGNWRKGQNAGAEDKKQLWRQGRKRDTGDRVKATGEGWQGTGKGREQGTAN